MGFIMRVFLNFKMIGLLLFSHLTFADFSIQDAKTHLVNDVYMLDAKFNYALTKGTIEALQNGVSLTLELNIVIERERRYWWNEEIATLKQRYELKYQALSKQYALKHLNTGIQGTFPSLEAALAHISEIKNYPMLDQHLIKYEDEIYWVYLQIRLDIESLPISLRLTAYLSSQWRLSSDWYLCPLQASKDG